ncbi:MAG: 4Fe-4S ferredoxin [Promethearchaeota archaeon CR_4]|nr:MAG: 4Fe-4S ferredoxin [Candidatus Lokiarchaeota archaeon CR_4]
MALKYEADGKVLEIDHDKCNGDAACVDVCPSSVFEIVGGKSTAPKMSECIECCACVSGCPEEAIKHSSC